MRAAASTKDRQDSLTTIIYIVGHDDKDAEKQRRKLVRYSERMRWSMGKGIRKAMFSYPPTTKTQPTPIHLSQDARGHEIERAWWVRFKEWMNLVFILQCEDIGA